MCAVPDHNEPDNDLRSTVLSVAREALAGTSRTEALRLDLQLVDAIAERVVQRLRDDVPSPIEWVDAATLARHMGVTRGWVYENADRLGARRLGDGPRARLRFNIAVAEQSSCFVGRWSEAPPSRMAKPKARLPRRSATGVVPDLLPIKGRSVPLPARSAA
jgi:hypothetical protein